MSVDLTMWSSEAWSSAADDYLLSQARDGSAEAYAELWRRNLAPAYAVAHRFRGRAAAEDIVAEASARVFGLISDGRGPAQNFRSYFLSTVKTVAIDGARGDLKLVPAAEEDLEGLTPPVVEDFDADLIDADLVRSAFRGLPERDQRILWHTTVEGESPRAIAPSLGMSPNTVSARASRARDALRARYLDARAERGIAAADSDECRWTIEHLGAHVQGRLPKRQEARVAAHLGGCDHTAGLAADLRVIDERFPVLVAPLAFLAGVSIPGFLSAPAIASLTSVGATGSAVTGPTSSAGHASVGHASADSTAGVAPSLGTAGSVAAVDIAAAAAAVAGAAAGTAAAVGAGAGGAAAATGAGGSVGGAGAGAAAGAAAGGSAGAATGAGAGAAAGGSAGAGAGAGGAGAGGAGAGAGGAGAGGAGAGAGGAGAGGAGAGAGGAGAAAPTSAAAVWVEAVGSIASRAAAIAAGVAIGVGLVGGPNTVPPTSAATVSPNTSSPGTPVAGGTPDLLSSSRAASSPAATIPALPPIPGAPGGPDASVPQGSPLTTPPIQIVPVPPRRSTTSTSSAPSATTPPITLPGSSALPPVAGTTTSPTTSPITEPTTPAATEPTTPPATEPMTPPTTEPTTPPTTEPTTPPTTEPTTPPTTTEPSLPPTYNPALPVLQYRWTVFPGVTFFDMRVDLQTLGKTRVDVSADGPGRLTVLSLWNTCQRVSAREVTCPGWSDYMAFSHTAPRLGKPTPITVTITMEDGTVITRTLTFHK